LQADKGHAAAHNGTGAVMGSKKLKAIAVTRGNKKVPQHDSETLRAISSKLYENVKTFSGTVGGVYRSQITPQIFGIFQKRNCLDLVKSIFERLLTLNPIRAGLVD
jgi:hypothetical protein